MFEMMAGRSPFDIITDNPDMNTEDYLFQGACPPALTLTARLSSFRFQGAGGGVPGWEPQCHTEHTGDCSSWPDPVTCRPPGCAHGHVAVGWGDRAALTLGQWEGEPLSIELTLSPALGSSTAPSPGYWLHRAESTAPKTHSHQHGLLPTWGHWTSSWSRIQCQGCGVPDRGCLCSALW
ncbi:Protein kinase C zeta type [Plecturocebus cupreus]